MAQPRGWTIYHNPRCSKSRAALEYLRERDVEPTSVEYLKTRPDGEEIESLLTKLGIGARELLRTGEDELGLADESKPAQDLIETMAAHSILIERPIII